MNIPPITPPTDNLYKFAAISGLLCAIALFIFATVHVDKLEEISDALTSDLAVSKIQAEHLKTETTFLQQELDAEKKLTRETTGRQDRKPLEAAIRDSEGNGRELRDKTRELAEKHALDEVKSRRLAATLSRAHSEIRSMAIFSSIAVLYSIWGFAMWHIRLQRPQDRLLEAQVAAGLKQIGSRGGSPTVIEAHSDG